MVNLKLLQEISPDILIKMGFKEDDDGSGDPPGFDYRMETNHFLLVIDPWGEVFLYRKNPDSDSITIHCETLFDLQRVIDWIKE